MGTLNHKIQIRLINEAVYDTRLTLSERKFYKWLSTQNKHRHMFFIFRQGWKFKWLQIDQKRKRR